MSRGPARAPADDASKVRERSEQDEDRRREDHPSIAGGVREPVERPRSHERDLVQESPTPNRGQREDPDVQRDRVGIQARSIDRPAPHDDGVEEAAERGEHRQRLGVVAKGQHRGRRRDPDEQREGDGVRH